MADNLAHTCIIPTSSSREIDNGIDITMPGVLKNEFIHWFSYNKLTIII